MIESKIHRLLIVSHVVHYQYQGKLYAYGPYAREIELWADLFPKVVIASPLHKELPAGDCIPFTHQNISISPQPERGGTGLKEKFYQVISIPFMTYTLSCSMHNADAIHIRCPGNIGLLGIILAPLFSHYRIAKYAGQWNDYPGESFSTKLQKSLLKSRWWGAPVTVYGSWPNQPNHIVPFFTSVMTDDQMTLAQATAAKKKMHHPLRILFVGRLSKSKNVDALLKAVHGIKNSGIDSHCRIIGDGPEQTSLIHLTHELNLEHEVEFDGGLPFEQVLPAYTWADILVLASETEGWPKAITEGMAFGLVCIGSKRGLVPQILGDGRGILVEPGDENQLKDALIEISHSELEYKRISQKAAAWSQTYTMTNLRKSLRELLIQRWGLTDEDLLQLPSIEKTS